MQQFPSIVCRSPVVSSANITPVFVMPVKDMLKESAHSPRRTDRPAVFSASDPPETDCPKAGCAGSSPSSTAFSATSSSFCWGEGKTSVPVLSAIVGLRVVASCGMRMIARPDVQLSSVFVVYASISAQTFEKPSMDNNLPALQPRVCESLIRTRLFPVLPKDCRGSLQSLAKTKMSCPYGDNRPRAFWQQRRDFPADLHNAPIELSPDCTVAHGIRVLR
jgi:hypothetical protein